MKKIRLGDILTGFYSQVSIKNKIIQCDLFGSVNNQRSMSLSNNNGFNDYFLFNDLRNGHSTIHSWDILQTTDRQKDICYLLLRNRRKNTYGNLDGNPLSLNHFRELDDTITQKELDELVKMDIMKKEEYSFTINNFEPAKLTDEDRYLLDLSINKKLNIDSLKSSRAFKINKIPILKTLNSLMERKIIFCDEIRYDFKNTKISTGLFGINRIFLPSSNIFPTLVASDSNDFITLKEITAKTETEYKKQFIEDVYKKKDYRKISKEEACLIQGFPKYFNLPDNRARWMKLLGNSVSVPVIEMLGKAILETGVFDVNQKYNTSQISNITTQPILSKYV